MTAYDTDDEFAKTVQRHVQAELDRNIDATMATISDIPRYEVHPLGYVISTQKSIAEFYRRVLVIFDNIEMEADSATFDATGAWRFSGPNGIIVHDFANYPGANGKPLVIKSLAMFVREPVSNLIKGEHYYLNGPTAQIFKDILGPSFLEFPGVSVEY